MISPALGRVLPAITANRVVLPAPFAPISPTISRRFNVEAHVFERGDAAEPL